jgi:hypothetical protein
MGLINAFNILSARKYISVFLSRLKCSKKIMFVSVWALFDMTTCITLCSVNVDTAHRYSTVPRVWDQAFDFSVLISI